MSEPSDLQDRVGSFWDEASARQGPKKTRWWMVPTVVRHLNAQLCGEPLEAASDGVIVRAKATLAARGARLPLARAVSVGGGHGFKEMRLISEGLVEHVDLFELSEARVEQGRRDAAARGLQAKVSFHLADAFAREHEPYDLVHWNNSLHHMLDTPAAVKWSREVLKPGGLFYMDDYVGPNRFQFDTRTLEIASDVRRGLEPRLLDNPHHLGQALPTTVRNIDPHRLAQADPSEAPDSARILDAVRTFFPGAEVLLTGGVVYALALKDALSNFDESDPADVARLQALLLLDEVATRRLQAQTQYAVALAFKEAEPSALDVGLWEARQLADKLRPDRDELRAAFRAAVPSAKARRAIGAARRRLRR